MKLNIRLISLLLSLIMVLGLFAACDSEPAETTEAEQNSSTTTEPVNEETDPPASAERTVFDLIVSGEAAVQIIRPENMTSDDPAVQAAVKIRNKIEDVTGVKLKMADDFKKATESYDDTAVEILVGPTRHAQVAQALEGLKYGDYAVKAVGNKIVVFGFTENAMIHAANELIKIITEYYDKNASEVNLTIPVEALNISGTHSGSM